MPCICPAPRGATPVPAATVVSSAPVFTFSVIKIGSLRPQHTGLIINLFYYHQLDQVPQIKFYDQRPRIPHFPEPLLGKLCFSCFSPPPSPYKSRPSGWLPDYSYMHIYIVHVLFVQCRIICIVEPTISCYPTDVSETRHVNFHPPILRSRDQFPIIPTCTNYVNR